MKEYESIVAEAQATDHLMGFLTATTLITVAQELNELMCLLKLMGKTADDCQSLVSDALTPTDYQVFKEMMKVQGRNMLGMGTDVEDLIGNTEAPYIDLKNNPRKAMVYGSPIIVGMALDIIAQHLHERG